jgi:hypothetical protein
MKQIILSEHITKLLVTPELVSQKMEATRRIKSPVKVKQG